MQVFEERSPIRLSITDSFDIDGIAVTIGLRIGPEEPTRVGRVNEYGSVHYEDVEPAANVTPTMRLSHVVARGLLNALLNYYGGAPDSHTVRADLLHERGRVDKMLTAFMEIASRPQTIQLRNAEQ